MAGAQWFVYGKHPMCADYFSLGVPSPLAAAYKNWVVQGYHQFVESTGVSRGGRGYRFWSLGGRRIIAFGLLRSSSDSIGRPFPLLIMATAALSFRQKEGPGFDQQLGPVWQEVEKLAAENAATLQDFSTALAKICVPTLHNHSVAESLPRTVFIGGGPGESIVVAFNGPLTLEDFVGLWTPQGKKHR